MTTSTPFGTEMFSLAGKCVLLTGAAPAAALLTRAAAVLCFFCAGEPS